MFWSSEDRVRARFHYAESRQNKPKGKSLGEICIEMLLTQEIINFTIIFKENPYQNAQQYVALWEGLIMDRLTGSNFWSSESRVKARFHYAES